MCCRFIVLAVNVFNSQADASWVKVSIPFFLYCFNFRILIFITLTLLECLLLDIVVQHIFILYHLPWFSIGVLQLNKSYLLMYLQFLLILDLDGCKAIAIFGESTSRKPWHYFDLHLSHHHFSFHLQKKIWEELVIKIISLFLDLFPLAHRGSWLGRYNDVFTRNCSSGIYIRLSGTLQWLQLGRLCI